MLLSCTFVWLSEFKVGVLDECVFVVVVVVVVVAVAATMKQIEYCRTIHDALYAFTSTYLLDLSWRSLGR
jgi:hypothetical protein